MMGFGESLTQSPSAREQVETILADKAEAEKLPKPIGFFTLFQELSDGNKQLLKIVNLATGSPLVLREGCFDSDGKILRVRVVDLLAPLVAIKDTSDKDLEDLLRLSRMVGAYHTNINLHKTAGEIVFLDDYRHKELAKTAVVATSVQLDLNHPLQAANAHPEH